MSDPDDQLSSFDPGLPMNPLPPTEVRRQGDRLRRRNTVMAGVGAALAVALVATPIAALRGGDQGPDPAPKPDHATEWVQTIPAEFPLDDMMGGEGSDFSPSVSYQEPYGEIVLPALDVCGADVWSPDAAVDVLGAVWSDGVEGGEQRTLALYGDADDARSALSGIETAVDGCAPSGPRDFDYLDLDSDLGEQSHAWVKRWRSGGEPTGATEVWQVARVGNALLLDKTYVPGTDPAVSQKAADTLADRASSVVDAMCVFAADGCDTPAPPPAVDATTPSSLGDIPAGFPLAAGWPSEDDAEPGPDSGLDGPSASLEPFDYSACETSAPEPVGTGELRARWSNPEDYRTRELLAFVDPGAAESFLEGMVDHYSGCPREDGSDGFTTVREVQEIGIGDRAHAVIQYAQYDGAPALGLQILHLVRVGRTVLIDATATEGTAASSRAQIGAQAKRSAEVVAAMCSFTEAGC